MAGYGTYAFNTIQLGRESIAGTPVAATIIWRGPAIDIEDQTETVMVQEDVGILLPGNRDYSPKGQAVLAMPETELTFEQVLHLLEAGIMTAPPEGLDEYVTRVYSFPTGRYLNTIKTYTVETGNMAAGDGNYMAHAFVEELTFSGAAGEAWKMSATWRGFGKTVNALTSPLSVIPVEEALFSKTKLYIDDAVIGTTQVEGALTSASITIKTGLQPVWTADGATGFYTHKFVRPEITWSLSFELENVGGIVAQERAAWVAGTARLIRLDCPGSSAAKYLLIDLLGLYSAFSTYNNQDGNTVVEASGACVYDAALSEYCTVTVINGTAPAVTNAAEAVTSGPVAVWQSPASVT
jgi:hypothetical protein